MSVEARTAHWGTCDNDGCQTSMVIYPHPDAPADLPEDTNDWEDSPFYIDCPVCGSSIMWGGTDPADSIIKGYR